VKKFGPKNKVGFLFDLFKNFRLPKFDW